MREKGMCVLGNVMILSSECRARHGMAKYNSEQNFAWVSITEGGV